MENTLPFCPVPNAPRRAKQEDLQMDVATPALDSGGRLEGPGQGSYHTWNGQCVPTVEKEQQGLFPGLRWAHYGDAQRLTASLGWSSRWVNVGGQGSRKG